MEAVTGLSHDVQRCLAGLVLPADVHAVGDELHHRRRIVHSSLLDEL